MKHENTGRWWGAPRKFSVTAGERKISWLELFYDLVYVVAISRITRYCSEHANLQGFLDYIYLFIMIFWGWFNGSMHHDLHGTPGIRTRLMTLWQMVTVAAMIVCLDGPQDHMLFRGTIAIMVMQLYITYLWWSVGIYDKGHRKLNRPYTVCYLISLLLIFSTLFLQQPYVRIAFFASLFFNFLPPFYLARRLQKNSFSLSSSMVERMGLFTIIIFGEVVTGVVGGANIIPGSGWSGWVNFVLAILIVFALWWIFFALIADRECKGGFLKGQLMVLLYIPVLMSLGMLGAAFMDIFKAAVAGTVAERDWLHQLFTVRIAVFLFGIVLISRFLVYPPAYAPAKKWLQRLLSIAGVVILSVGFGLKGLSLFTLFTIVFVLLLSIIVTFTLAWLRFEEA